MFNLFQRGSDHRVIDGGQVFCSNRGCDIDMEVCAGCRWLLEINEKAKAPFVRCEPEPVSRLMEMRF